jgi:hypothetical protein
MGWSRVWRVGEDMLQLANIPVKPKYCYLQNCYKLLGKSCNIAKNRVEIIRIERPYKV